MGAMGSKKIIGWLGLLPLQGPERSRLPIIQMRSCLGGAQEIFRQDAADMDNILLVRTQRPQSVWGGVCMTFDVLLFLLHILQNSRPQLLAPCAILPGALGHHKVLCQEPANRRCKQAPKRRRRRVQGLRKHLEVHLQRGKVNHGARNEARAIRPSGRVRTHVLQILLKIKVLPKQPGCLGHGAPVVPSVHAAGNHGAWFWVVCCPVQPCWSHNALQDRSLSLRPQSLHPDMAKPPENHPRRSKLSTKKPTNLCLVPVYRS
jgi:hypothetical protein